LPQPQACGCTKASDLEDPLLSPELIDRTPIDFGILSQKMDRDDIPKSGDKFVVGKFIGGRPVVAAHGLASYMGIAGKSRWGKLREKDLRQSGRSLFENGTASGRKIMEYILDEVAVVEEEVVSYGTVMKDEGHENMRLKDFLKCAPAQKAKLELKHVAALRLYTPQAYTCINNPLRHGDMDDEHPHPFAATTYYLSEALKKLRSVNSDDGGPLKRKEFWRGMKVEAFFTCFSLFATELRSHIICCP
jgi:hypothetical protein